MTHASSPRTSRRRLAVAAGVVAASAYGGAVGLATRTDPYLRHLYDKLPLRSPALGAAALVTVVAVPYSVLATYAWQGHDRTNAAAVVTGGLLVGWLIAEDIIIGERHWIAPVYYAAGALTVVAGRRWLVEAAERLDRAHPPRKR